MHSVTALRDRRYHSRHDARAGDGVRADIPAPCKLFGTVSLRAAEYGRIALAPDLVGKFGMVFD